MLVIVSYGVIVSTTHNTGTIDLMNIQQCISYGTLCFYYYYILSPNNLHSSLCIKKY